MSDSMTLKLLGNGRHYTPNTFFRPYDGRCRQQPFGLVANGSARSW